MYERNVIQAGEWARAYRAALAHVYAAFTREGEWPKIETLQRELNRSGDTHDLITELQGMPASLGVIQHEGWVALSIRGLSTVPQAVPLLIAYMEVIKLAVDRYRGNDDEPRVTDSDLRDELRMDGELAKRVGVLVFSEGWPFGSGGGEAGGSWYRDVPVELRHLIGAADIDDFLAVQAKLRYGSSGLPPFWEAQPMSPAPIPPVVAAEADTWRPGHGGSLSLSPTIFRQLVFRELAKLEAENYFVEAFVEGEHMALAGDGTVIAAPPRIEDPEAWLMLNLNVEGLWPQLQDPSELADSSSTMGVDDKDLLLRMLELLHDVVSTPILDSEGSFEGFYDRASGQAMLREVVAPILARLEPPMEIRSDGGIVAKSAPGLEALGDQPLPTSSVADDIRAKVLDAIRAFRDVGATAEGQLSALSQLAGILERLRADGRLEGVFSKKDQGPLFEIANEFGIRHDKPGQKRDYGPAFREWIFFAYLAAIRLAMRVIDGDNGD
jgi:hypothetical protein